MSRKSRSSPSAPWSWTAHIVTSRGPSTAVAFAIALIGELVSVEKSRAIAADVLLAD
jgi:hypothetical protein